MQSTDLLSQREISHMDIMDPLNDDPYTHMVQEMN
jgi:hypothetical protein